MRFVYRQENRGDRLLDILTDEEKGLRIAVSRLGAELVSIARRDRSGQWIGFLYRDNDITIPERGWANHATVMGYYLHRLKDGRSIYRGREIRGGTHGFLRHATWHPIESKPGETGRLAYRISQADYSAEDYPLNVSLDLTYQVSGAGVTTQFRFQNHEPELVAHVSFGLHPGFAATSFDTFKLEMPRGRYRRYFSPDNFLAEETQEFDFDGGEMPFPREKLPGSYILELTNIPEPRFGYGDPLTGRSVELDLTGVPYVTLWSDGGPFLCIEPCWGLTDHHRQRAFEDKAGIQRIEPGGELIRQFTMRPELNTAA